MSKKWSISVLEACIRQAHPNTRNFTRKDLIKNDLPIIIQQTQTKGKTPDMTMNRILQDLRDINLICFISPGQYCLLDKQIEIERLLQSEKKMSKGEKLVSRILNDLNINFEREKTFSDLKNKSFLRFDFFFKIEGRGFVIEFDGRQHFHPVEYFGGIPKFIRLIENDKIKNDYCEKNEICIIRINDLNFQKAKQLISADIYQHIKDLPKLRSEHAEERNLKNNDKQLMLIE